MRSERWKKHPSFALVIHSGKKTQRIACVFEFINIFKIYITKSLSKMYSKHPSLSAAYFTQTPFLPKKQTGGVVPKRKFRVVAKYSTEARGCYGACCPVIDGVEKGDVKKYPLTSLTVKFTSLTVLITVFLFL